MKFSIGAQLSLYVLAICLFLSCNSDTPAPSKELIGAIYLKRGSVISCGPADKQFGSVDFEMNCSKDVKEDFNLAIVLLHSFEYDEAEKVFAKVIDKAPGCAMAYWGVAMSNFHPLWTPPTEPELEKGSKAIQIAQSVKNTSAKEAAYINSLSVFYNDWKSTDHITRCIRYEKAMEKLHIAYPDDKEAASLYALALDASAKPGDKNYTNQKKAAEILNGLYKSAPNHPGIIHYLIHTYDYPELATLALPFARKYATVAPSSAHALHMPSHIFTRLGLWDESIKSNLVSVASAKCYAEQAGFKGHWDEELHGMDYLVYGYLQKGNNKAADVQLKYLQTITEVYPPNFKVAYAFASIPSRICLENKDWQKAAALKLYPSNVPWHKFPWQESIMHFSRLLGASHLKNFTLANTELARLQQLHDTLTNQKDTYKAGQVAIQIKAGQAWILFFSGKKIEALNTMKLSASMEDSTEKHPVTAGEVLPARELLADMFLLSGEYSNAFIEYKKVLQKTPNRFNSLYGAGFTAEKSGDKEQAGYFYKQLLAVADTIGSEREEVGKIKKFFALR